MPIGRPSSFTEDTALEICERIAKGMSLRAVCRDPEMPHLDTVRVWLLKRPSFAAQYAQAREQQMEVLSEDIIDISDDATPEEAAVAKLRVDTRKWIMSKLKPKKYGEKLEQQQGGNLTIRVVNYADSTSSGGGSADGGSDPPT